MFLFPLASQADLPSAWRGDSLQGLTESETNVFRMAREAFLHVQEIAQGLGPAYNGRSCAGCHNQPSMGGIGIAAVLRAGVVHDGNYELPSGGDLVHLFSIGDHACQPHIPSGANNLARRTPTPLYRAGLMPWAQGSQVQILSPRLDANEDSRGERLPKEQTAPTNNTHLGAIS